MTSLPSFVALRSSALVHAHETRRATVAESEMAIAREKHRPLSHYSH